jgi:drug/metabolite transporter (DMT)-like permease
LNSTALSSKSSAALRSRALVELILAAIIWGFGFVATVWALKDFSIVGFLVLRFAIGALVGELIRLIFLRRKFWDSNDFKYSIPAGLIMASFILPQSLGLLFTTATNSGFLTIMYVVIVPILSFRKKHSWPVYALAALAFFGAWLLMNAVVLNFNKGDLWTLLCAFMASLHILYLGKIAPKIKDSFRFNNYQSFWCLLAVLPFITIDSKFSIQSNHLLPWLGLLSTAIGSTIIGFMIQIRAQKILSETTAAQFFLLESPFALLFGVLILNERINWLQASGAFLILLSSFLTLKVETKSEQKNL